MTGQENKTQKYTMIIIGWKKKYTSLEQMHLFYVGDRFLCDLNNSISYINNK